MYHKDLPTFHETKKHQIFATFTPGFYLDPSSHITENIPWYCQCKCKNVLHTFLLRYLNSLPKTYSWFTSYLEMSLITNQNYFRPVRLHFHSWFFHGFHRSLCICKILNQQKCENNHPISLLSLFSFSETIPNTRNSTSHKSVCNIWALNSQKWKYAKMLVVTQVSRKLSPCTSIQISHSQLVYTQTFQQLFITHSI